MKKSIAALVLTVAMLLSLCVTAFASEPIVNDSIGSVDSQTGILLNDLDPFGSASILATDRHLFSMSAVGVTDLLTTYGVSGKHFTYSDIRTGTICYYGTLTAANYGSGNKPSTIKAGVCYLDTQTNLFVSPSGCYGYFTEGTFCRKYISQSALSSGRTYYGFIKHQSSSGVPNAGSVSGSLAFCDSNRS